MPTYEYQCQDCQRRVEYFQSMKEEPRKVCPRCGGRLARLVSTGTGLIFKGSGFYITDYKRKESDLSKHQSGHRTPLEHGDNGKKDVSGETKADTKVTEESKH